MNNKKGRQAVKQHIVLTFLSMIRLKDASETEDAISLLFFTEFPSLEEYCLAYDFNYPRVDMSDPERRYPS